MPLRFLIILTTSCLFVSCFKEDKTAPVITLKGEKNTTSRIGKAFVEPGYEAKDNRDGDISYLVKVEGNVDSTKAGIYHLSYNVQDASENYAIEQVRTVFVTHYNQSLAGIYDAEGYCRHILIDNSNYFVAIEPSNSNGKSIQIKAVNNLSKDEELVGNITSNTGSNILIPPHLINDTLYSGKGTINPTGSEITFTIYVSAGNFKDTCFSVLTRQIR